ncbi:MAG: hypothetical protein KC468_36285 [Myxococcales bacterium]|nr:hypothetical protein [Myxococcales bacterium]
MPHAHDPRLPLALTLTLVGALGCDPAPTPRAGAQARPAPLAPESAERDEPPGREAAPEPADEPAPERGDPGATPTTARHEPGFIHEYPDARCDGGDDCLRKGYEQFDLYGGIDKDRQLAFVYFRLGCQRDHARACYEQGEMFGMLGLGSYPNTEWADAWELELFEKGCRGGYGDSCNRWAARLEGAERQAAYRMSIPRLEAACEAGEVMDCSRLAYNLNLGRGTAMDEPRAAALFKRACERRDAYACESYAVALQNGAGVTRDLGAARRWLKKGCAIEPEDCGQLTGAIRLKGVPRGGG